MKLKDAMPIYQRYRQQLVDQTRSLVKQRDAAKAKFEATNDQTWSDEAATLQLSIEKTQEEFNKNQEVLDGLTEQWCLAANAENAKALADPETGMAATMAKIMTTVARMCAGDKVPYADEKKLMEYDSDLYGKAKQAQMKSRRNTILSGMMRKAENTIRKVSLTIPRHRANCLRCLNYPRHLNCQGSLTNNKRGVTKIP